jgi:copper chaperone NosL
MLGFSQSGFEPADNILQQLVVDFDSPGKLTDATSAFFIQSEQVRSPMGSQIAAFAERGSMQKFNQEWSGAMLKWEELAGALK